MCRAGATHALARPALLTAGVAVQVAAISYARKKTRDSASTAITQCLGAGSMNNTFCLGAAALHPASHTVQIQHHRAPLQPCRRVHLLTASLAAAIFLALIYFQNLTWEFSAESISIVFIEVVVALISMRRVQVGPAMRSPH